MPTETSSNSQLEWRAFTGKVATPTLVFSILLIGLYALVIYLGINKKLSFLTCGVLNTILTYLIFTPLHEATHGNISGKNKQLKGVENVIGWLSGLTLTLPFPMFKYLHFTHHSHTNDEEKDPDYWVASQNRFYVLLRCMTMIGDYYNCFFKNYKEQIANPTTKNRFYSGAIGLVTIHLFGIFWGMQMGWQYPIYLWVVPALAAGTFLAFAFNYLPHHPHAVQKRYLDTRIILFPGFTILLLSQNMHLIHHLYPNIPFYKYGAAFKKMRKHLESKGARIEDWLKKEHEA